MSQMAVPIRKWGERKVVVTPDGSVLPTAPRHVTTNADPSPLKALGRAFRWERLLDDGTYASVSDIARAEKLDRTYVGDVLRLTLLAPEIVEAALNAREAVTNRMQFPCCPENNHDSILNHTKKSVVAEPGGTPSVRG